MANSDMCDVTPETLFKQWLEAHAGMVLKVARAYTWTAADCDDLVQEILFQVWRSLPQFAGRSSNATWSYRVALNTALCWQRKEGRRLARQQPLIQPEALETNHLNSAEEVSRREILDRLYTAIRQLPKTDAALVLLYLDDFGYREMAEVLGISESNVGVRLNRAKKALAESMKEVVHES